MKPKQTSSSTPPSKTPPETDYDETPTPAQIAYWNSLHKEVIEAEKVFWAQNELVYKQGAREPDCPPNYIRSNIPRSLTYDPGAKFANKRRRNKVSVLKRNGKIAKTRSGNQPRNKA